MSKFNELNTNLMSVLFKLLESQDLCKLLYYDTDNPYAETDITDTSTLLFSKIFPIPKIPTIKTKESSMITVIFDDIRIGTGGTAFKNSMLCINTFCHIDKWQLKGTGKLRIYSIMQEIDNKLNNERVIGIGKMQFNRSRFIGANEQYFGYQTYYSVLDFN